MRARGLRPSACAFSSLITSVAAAPSLSGQALPAVTVPSSLKTGLSDGELLHRRARPRAVVLGDDRAVGQRDRDDLLVEVPALLRVDRAVLRDDRPLVLGLARDVAALGHVLGGQAHRDVDVVLRLRRAVEHRVERDVRARRARHGLRAAGDVLVALAGLDRVEGHADRLQRATSRTG